MKLPPDQKFFIWDAESVGLHGEGFAVAGGVYDINGTAISEFAFHTEPGLEMGVPGRQEEDFKWIAGNVSIHTESNRCIDRYMLRAMFWENWDLAKAEHPGILMFVECGWPVEARFLIECIEDGPEDRNWAGPYPMHEIATLMLAAGMDPMATYERRQEELPAHEPLADARLSARLLSEAAKILTGRAALADSFVP